MLAQTHTSSLSLSHIQTHRHTLTYVHTHTHSLSLTHTHSHTHTLTLAHSGLFLKNEFDERLFSSLECPSEVLFTLDGRGRVAKLHAGKLVVKNKSLHVGKRTVKLGTVHRTVSRVTRTMSSVRREMEEISEVGLYTYIHSCVYTFYNILCVCLFCSLLCSTLYIIHTTYGICVTWVVYYVSVWVFVLRVCVCVCVCVLTH